MSKVYRGTGPELYLFYSSKLKESPVGEFVEKQTDGVIFTEKTFNEKERTGVVIDRTLGRVAFYIEEDPFRARIRKLPAAIQNEVDTINAQLDQGMKLGLGKATIEETVAVVISDIKPTDNFVTVAQRLHKSVNITAIGAVAGLTKRLLNRLGD